MHSEALSHLRHSRGRLSRMNLWHYSEHGAQKGPIDDAALRHLIATGAIGAGTLVWRAGMDAWKPAGELPELAEPIAAARPPVAGFTPPRSPLGIAPPPPVVTGDATGGIIPYKNPKALIAYYLGICALVPCAGWAFGIASITLGILGLRGRRRNPQIRGSVHAWIGIVIGAISIIAHAVILAVAGL